MDFPPPVPDRLPAGDVVYYSHPIRGICIHRKGKKPYMFFKKVEEFKKVVREMPVDEIWVPEERVRRIVPDPSLSALADSLSRHGMIEPIIVRQETDPTAECPKRILVAGERRLRAARLCGWATVPSSA